MPQRDMFPTACILSVLVCLFGSPAFARGPGDKFPTYDTPYYVIHTDLDPDALREAKARLVPLAETYYKAVQPFAGGKKVTKKFQFYLFSKEEDFHASGGPPQGKGVFNGQEVLAFMPQGEWANEGWKNLQHECLHQFVHVFVCDNLPPWLNEGLAVYYSEAIWTGDGYVPGGIPSIRRKTIQGQIKDKSVVPLAKFLKLTQTEWVSTSGDEMLHWYNQGWSMVYFLMHADGGKYQKLLNDFIKDIQAGKPIDASFAVRFGHDGGPLGKRYDQWWTEMGEEPSPEVYAQASVAILTSFLARATAGGTKFKDVNDFLDQNKEAVTSNKGDFPNKTDQWLPGALLMSACLEAQDQKDWHWFLDNGKKFPKWIMKSDDGMVYTGTFDYVPKRVTKKGPDGKSQESIDLSRLHVDVTAAKSKTAGGGLRQ